MSISQVQALIHQMQNLRKTSHIRCPEHEEQTVSNLANQLLCDATALSNELLKKINAPNEVSLKIVRQLSSLSVATKSNGSKYIKNNLRTIFNPPLPAPAGNRYEKWRKKELRTRCKLLASLRIDQIVIWSSCIRMSDWNPGMMPRTVFEYVTAGLVELPPQVLGKDVADFIEVLSSEPALRNSETFCFMMRRSMLTGDRNMQMANDASRTEAIAGTDDNGQEHQRNNESRFIEERRGDTFNEADQHLQKLTARMANVAEVEKVFGNFLYMSMVESRLRREEVKNVDATFTDAVRLHMATAFGDDFALDVWLGSVAASTIDGLKENSQQKLLGTLLGTFISQAISSAPKAISIIYPDENEADCLLRLKLAFEKGRDFFEKVFSSARSID